MASRPALRLAPVLLTAGLVALSCASEPTTSTRPAATQAAEGPTRTTPHGPAEPAATISPARTGPRTSDGRAARAELHIPRLGIRGLVVVPYRGRTDDARGTAIQNDGYAASPHGPHGGVGPGGVGNYQVTGHRLSSTQPFRHLPQLGRGDRVVVETSRWRHVYEIVDTRSTSFRSARSLAEQRAAVPGRPGAKPTRAMITLSTCAAIEDHAAGNYWADRFDNPEHRIDKIGVLVRTRPTAGAPGPVE